MGIFPHFFGGSPLTHVTHFTEAVLTGGVTEIFPKYGKAVAKLATGLVSSGVNLLHHIGSVQTTPKAALPEHINQPVVYREGAPAPPPPYYPSPFAPPAYSYAPAADNFSPYGGPSWGYSTTSPEPWIAPSPVYSEEPVQRDRSTWEDLTSLVPLFTSIL